MEINVAGISSMSFNWKLGGFGFPCTRCGAENAPHQLVGNLPPEIAGYYCDACHKQACAEASKHYQTVSEEGVKTLKTTVIFRKEGAWSTGEMLAIAASTDEEVWTSSQYPNYLVVPGHCAKAAFRAIPRTLRYKIEHLVGTEKLPFVPLL